MLHTDHRRFGHLLKEHDKEKELEPSSKARNLFKKEFEITDGGSVAQNLFLFIESTNSYN